MPRQRGRCPENSESSDENPDIRGYPPEDSAPDVTDIPGYPTSQDSACGADSDRYPDDGVVGMPDGAPLFQDSGFESLDDYLEHLEDLWRRQNGLPPLMPAGLKPVRPRDGFGSRQVGLRLPEADFRRLGDLSDEYGVAPATMARMIVVGALRSRRVPED